MRHARIIFCPPPSLYPLLWGYGVNVIFSKIDVKNEFPTLVISRFDIPYIKKTWWGHCPFYPLGGNKNPPMWNKFWLQVILPKNDMKHARIIFCPHPPPLTPFLGLGGECHLKKNYVKNEFPTLVIPRFDTPYIKKTSRGHCPFYTLRSNKNPRMWKKMQNLDFTCNFIQNWYATCNRNLHWHQPPSPVGKKVPPGVKQTNLRKKITGASATKS